jgi:NAD(P)-dependent dehydrogenase (short-subunit alcohol dehydrogenase family)
MTVAGSSAGVLKPYLEDRVAIVTGGSMGIGEATVTALVRHRARVVIVARDDVKGTSVCERVGSDRAVMTAGDVANAETARRAVSTAIDRFGRLDILINNAGIDLSSSPLLETAEADIRRVVDVNFIGSALMLQSAAAAMRTRGGSIINVTSRAALVGIPGMAVYGAAKGALQSLTRAAAVELAPWGIRVNAVAPGLTETSMVERWISRQPDPAAFRAGLSSTNPLGVLTTPEEVAAAIVYLASDEAASVTGASISIDGGFTAA